MMAFFEKFRGIYMKSVRQKIFLCCILIVGISLIVLGTFAGIMMYQTTMNSVKKDTQIAADLASDRITWELNAYENIVTGLGVTPSLSNESVSNDKKKSILDMRASENGLAACSLINSKGDCIDGNNYSERDYFKRAMQGETTFTEPFISNLTGELIIVIAAPLWKDGIYGSEVIGCVLAQPDSEFLNEIVRNINVSDNNSAYIIDSEGNTIADVDSDVVKNGENIEALAAADTTGTNGYQALADVHSKMRKGETGFAGYKYKGVYEFVAYAPIAETEGWTLAVCAPRTDFMDDTFRSIILSVMVLAAACIVSTFIARRVGSRIGNSVRICTERIEQFAAGDLTSEVPTINSKDETGRLSVAAKTVVSNTNNIIKDIGRILEAMSQGNFDVHTSKGEQYYIGDYQVLLQYLRNINHNLSSTMSRINEAADQVAAGSDQVSAGAQALSQGATEQASSIEELAATIGVISDKVNENAKHAENAMARTNETAGKINDAGSRMDDLVAAMDKISASSDQIRNIIKTIEDIAFQTNILALNAAVEAARAGEAGKGFAVVADEVRNLAGKSAEAANSTNNLIEASIEAVQNGNTLVAEVADMMNGVETATEQVITINRKISDSSSDAAESIKQVSVGIDQISCVVQTNSATAEESAAASEELSGQASMLKELMSSFTLRDEE